MAMEKRKTYYYLVIVLMTFLMMFVGTQSSSGFSIMVNAVKESAGLSGSASSLIFTVKNISAFVFVFFADKYYQKLGLRLGVSLAFIYGLVAMLICMVAGSNVVLYYVGGIFLGAAYAFSMMLPMALIIRAWFNKSRALAMSICSAGTGVSGFVMSPIMQALVNSYGVSSAFLFLAATFGIVAVLFFLFVRNSPDEVGLEPYGGAAYVEASSKGKKAAGVPQGAEKFVIGFVAAAFFMGLVSPPSQQHFVMHFTNLGYDSMLVASAYSVCGLTLVFSKLGFGVLSQKMPFGTLSVIFLLCYLVALVLSFAIGGMGVAGALPFAICIIWGIAGAVCTLGYTNWIADFTDKDAYAGKVKNAQTAYQGAEIIGSFIPGVVMDMTGHYTLWYGFGAIAMVIIILIVIRAYSWRKRVQGAM